MEKKMAGEVDNKKMPGQSGHTMNEHTPSAKVQQNSPELGRKNKDASRPSGSKDGTRGSSSHPTHGGRGASLGAPSETGKGARGGTSKPPEYSAGRGEGIPGKNAGGIHTQNTGNGNEKTGNLQNTGNSEGFSNAQPASLSKGRSLPGSDNRLAGEATGTEEKAGAAPGGEANGNVLSQDGKNAVYDNEKGREGTKNNRNPEASTANAEPKNEINYSNGNGKHSGPGENGKNAGYGKTSSSYPKDIGKGQGGVPANTSSPVRRIGSPANQGMASKAGNERTGGNGADTVTGSQGNSGSGITPNIGQGAKSAGRAAKRGMSGAARGVGKAGRTAAAGALRGLRAFVAKAAVTSKLALTGVAVAGGIFAGAVGYAGMNMRYQESDESEIASGNVSDARIMFLSAANESGGNPIRVELNGRGIGVIQFTYSIDKMINYCMATGNSIYDPLKPYVGMSNQDLWYNEEFHQAWCDVVDAPLSSMQLYGSDYITTMNVNKANVFINDQATVAVQSYFYADYQIDPQYNNGYDIRNAPDVIKGIAFSINILNGTGSTGLAFSGVKAGMSTVEVINLCYDNLTKNMPAYADRWTEERALALELAAEGDTFNPFVKRGKVDWTWRNGGNNSEGSSRASETKNSSSSGKGVLFIGDSRTVGMKAAVSSKANWVCEVSMGYNWMVKSAFSSADAYIKGGNVSSVVILLGVNDLGNASNYAKAINSKAAEWKAKGVKTYFVSVNGVDDSKSIYAKNYMIQNFNATVAGSLSGVSYIDTYNSVSINSNNTDAAGVHFDSETYKKIYNLILARVSTKTGTSQEQGKPSQGIIDQAVTWAVQIANDNSHGYNNSGNGWGPDEYNCIGLVMRAYKSAGHDPGYCNISEMPDYLMAAGFIDVTDEVNLQNGSGAVKGDVFWVLYPSGEHGHTEMYMGDGKLVGARGDFDGRTGDGSGNEISVISYSNMNWQRVFRLETGLSEESDAQNRKVIDWMNYDWESWDWEKAGYLVTGGWQNDPKDESGGSNGQAAENAKLIAQQKQSNGWVYCQAHRGGYCSDSGAFSYDCSWTVWAAYNGGSYDGLSLNADTYQDGSSKLPMAQTGNMLLWVYQNHKDKLLEKIVPFGSSVPQNQIPVDKLQPGDVFFIAGSDPTSINGVTTSHVNIYVGDGMVVDGGSNAPMLQNISTKGRSVVAIYRP